MRFTRRILACLFALGLSLAPSVPAFATILFAGGEDVDFLLIGTARTDTNSAHFRSGYAREALFIDDLLGVPSPNRISTPTFANNSTIWVHAENFPQTLNTFNGLNALGVYGSDGVLRLLIQATGGAGQVKISTRNGAGTITDLVTCLPGGWPVNGALNKLDWYINYAVSGHTTLYSNGVQICDYAGNITTDSVTAVNQVIFGNPAVAAISWSEVVISTTDTRSMNLFTCAPAANGTTMTWTGAYTNVNPTTIDDTSSITTGSNAQIAEFTCPSLPAGTFTVPAVSQTLRVQIGATGPQNFYFIARPAGGSNYNNGATTLGTVNFENYSNIWALNPATSGAWSTANLGAGVNFGIESEP